MRPKKPVMTALLPATPCTPEMATQFRTIAEKEGRSLADLQRQAFSLFLRDCASLTTEEVRLTNMKELTLEGQS